MSAAVRRGAVALALATLTWPSAARAQQTGEAFLADGTHANALRATVGLDPALVFGLGYMRAVEVGGDDVSRRLGLHFDVTTILGLSSWDFTGGVSVLARQQTGFDVLSTLDLRLKVAQNDVHTAVVYGYGAAVRPGWFSESWYAALDLALRGSFAASVFHTDAYREMFAEAADGTYASDHLNLFLGAALGFNIKQRVLIGGRFAWRAPRTFESYAPYFMPYTVNVDTGVRF